MNNKDLTNTLFWCISAFSLTHSLRQITQLPSLTPSPPPFVIKVANITPIIQHDDDVIPRFKLDKVKLCMKITVAL